MSAAENVSVQVTHRYSHPCEKVFDAWLDPKIAGKFLFATETGEIVRCDIDPRVGGKFAITDRRDGNDVEHVGEYLEIERPRRLKFTFGVPAYSSDRSIVTIDIMAIEKGCELTLTTELKREWADRTREGWSKILRTLQGILDSHGRR